MKRAARFELFDLTMLIGHGTPAFPLGLREVTIEHELVWETHGANADRIALSCHAGTHLDGPAHFAPRGGAPCVCEIPIAGGRLLGEGVVADISGFAEDYGFYGRDEVLASGAEVRKGDILVIHTGYHRFQHGLPGADPLRYFYRHPGPRGDFAAWCLEMDLNWLGVDCGSQDHPFNTGLRGRVPEEDRSFCAKHGVGSVAEIFPPGDWQIMHRALFPRGIVHVENVGGQVGEVLNRRCLLGCFPLRIEAESSPCRLVALIER